MSPLWPFAAAYSDIILANSFRSLFEEKCRAKNQNELDKAAFKELLEDFEIRAGAKWDETAKQIAADERFVVCNAMVRDDKGPVRYGDVVGLRSRLARGRCLGVRDAAFAGDGSTTTHSS